MRWLSPRRAFALAAAACAALLGYGYYLQYGQGLQPCPLCLVQRGFFYAVLAIALVAALHGRRVRIYGVAMGLVALGGAGVAGRQVWLQHLPPDKVPQCGPDLYFMLEHFPLSRTLTSLVQGTGECAVVDWTFLGFSIAEWSLACFLGLAGWGVWLVLRRKPSPRL